MSGIPNFDQLEAAVAISGTLEDSLTQHAGMYFHVAIGAARADALGDEFKYELLCKEAELQERVRTEAAAAGEKVTETLVTARVKAHAEYSQVNHRYLGATKRAGEWDALRRAYESRGHILHDLTLLAGRGVDSSSISNYGALREAAATARRNATSGPLKK